MSTLTTERQDVGQCPRCKHRLKADVELRADPGLPFQESDTGRWVCRATVTIVRVHLEHDCNAEDDPDLAGAFVAALVTKGAKS